MHLLLLCDDHTSLRAGCVCLEGSCLCVCMPWCATMPWGVRTANRLSTAAGADWALALASEGPSEGLTALAAAAALSVRSRHPISQAVASCAQHLGSALPQLQLQDFRQEPGLSHPPPATLTATHVSSMRCAGCFEFCAYRFLTHPSCSYSQA